MFKKDAELGVGSFGVVHRVICLQNSVVRSNPASSADTTSAQATNQSAAKSTGTNVKKTGGYFIGGSGPPAPGVSTRAMVKQQEMIRELVKD